MTVESRLRVRICGEGAPPFFMLIHGMASSGRIWLKMLKGAGLAGARGTLIVPDLAGMGESAFAPGITYEDWVESLRREALSRCAAACTARGPSPDGVHLVGHSLGGALAVSLAREDWVASVALLAPATGAFCDGMRRACRPGRSPGSVLLRRTPGSLAHDPRRLSREDAAILREDHESAIPLLEEGLPWPYFPEKEPALLKGKPVLVVWGEEDRVVLSTYARALVDELAAAGIAVEGVPIRNCGHVPMLEYPEETARILQGFWNRHGIAIVCQ